MFNPLYNYFAKWVPDEYSKRCLNCKRKFNIFIRKHHCRRCGYLLCKSCCGHFVQIKEFIDENEIRHKVKEEKPNLEMLSVYVYILISY